MDIYQIGGLVITAVLAILGYIKMELIKRVVNRIISDEGKVNFLSIFVLTIISIIPTVIGFNASSHTSENDFSKQNIEIHQVPKSDLEVGLEIGKEAVTTVKELYDERKQNKRIKDSIFLSNRPQRWVYQIGNVKDNDESVFDLYKKLNKTDNICLFKHKNDFLLFKNIDFTENQLYDSLDSFASQIGNSLTVIDLMTYCTDSEEKIKKTKSYRLGKRKDKKVIECYIVDK